MDPKILTTHAITPVCDSGRLELKARGCGEGKRRREGSGDTLGGGETSSKYCRGSPPGGAGFRSPEDARKVLPGAERTFNTASPYIQ